MVIDKIIKVVKRINLNKSLRVSPLKDMNNNLVELFSFHLLKFKIFFKKIRF